MLDCSLPTFASLETWQKGLFLKKKKILLDRNDLTIVQSGAQIRKTGLLPQTLQGIHEVDSKAW
jgi:hypothetical protein